MLAFIQCAPELKDLINKDFLRDPPFLTSACSNAFSYSFSPNHNSIKHWIETLGLPHTEVGRLVLQNSKPGRSLDFNYKPLTGDVIIVEPLIGPVDVTQVSPLRPVAFKPHHFIVDECVMSLAPKLRMLGCDVVAQQGLDDKEVVQISATEKRIILTKDRGLLKRKEAVWGRFVRSQDPQKQLNDVIRFFGLRALPQALMRCLVCNGQLQSIAKEKILDQLAPKTILYFNDFSRCEACGKIYWEGSHYSKMVQDMAHLPLAGTPR